MSNIHIELDAKDCFLRERILGLVENETKNRQATHTFVGTYTQKARRSGITAEIAFAKWLDVGYGYKPYNKSDADVLGYQIKATELKYGSLIMQPHNPAGVYVLGIVNAGFNQVSFMGWALSQEIQQDCYWRDDVPKPGWFMPQSKLWSMDELTETAELAAHHGAF